MGLKNKLIKAVSLIFIVLILASLVSAITYRTQAVTDVTEDPDFWKPNDEDISTALDQRIEIIVAVVKTVGIIISVGTLSVIGIKFMLGSIEERAQYKQTLIPWLIGATLLFTLTTLPSFLYGIIQGANGTSEVNISLNKSNITLKIGENDEATLLAIVTVDGVKSSTKVKWSSSNNQIATVDAKGKVTAKSNGTAIIKATHGKGEAICTVKVEAARTTNVTISKNEITIDAPMTMTYQLQATITPSNSREPLIWTSSNTSVATVQNGKVRAVGVGTATITAKSGEKSATCKVTVNSSRVYKVLYYNPENKNVFTSRTSVEDIGFWIYIPDVSLVKDVDKLPLIVFLHGAGELGSNINILNNMYPFYLKEKDYPAIVIYPQCTNTWISVHQKVKGIIDYSIANYNVDADKVALTGFSWGGTGTWEIGLQYPTLFSCIVPVCGYSSISATTYPDCPVWAIGSSGDGTKTYAKEIGTLLKKAGKK